MPSKRHSDLPRDGSRRPFGATAGALMAFLTIAGVLAVTGGAALAGANAVPQSTGQPSVSGRAEVGSTLTGTQGTWSGSPTSYAYQWVRCSAAGGKPDGSDCAAIGGATTLKYVVATADVDRRLRFRVTASNADGSQTAASNATALVKQAAAPATSPRNTKAPAVSGTPNRDQVLHVSAGTWSGTQPITFSYEWLRCDTNGNNCSSLSGFNDDAYTVREGDVGKRLRARVTARNSSGSANQLAAATSVIGGPLTPADTIKLANGETSVPVTSVPKGERLIVDQVVFSPNPVRTRETFSARVKVKDTRGFVVRDAIVFMRSTPLVTTATRSPRTGQDGWVTIEIQPRYNFPTPRPDRNVQFFIRAYRVGDPVLAGVSGRRLVQVALGR